jgi:hypothetical protein
VIDLLLDANDELVLHDGDLALTTEDEGTQQAVRFSLRFFQGEWFLDESEGIPYFTRILIKNPNLVEVREWFREAIATSPGIQSVDFVELRVMQDRRLHVKWSANGGIVTGESEFP